MSDAEALRAGDQVPHFDVEALDHTRVAYPEIWQRKNLLLVLLPDDPEGSSERYIAALRERMRELIAHDTACVIARDAVAGAPQPGVLIADRWGEIQFVAGGRIEDLPSPDALIEWLRFVQVQCPECQGEAR